MPASILAPDQVNRINATYPRLLAHLRELLTKDHTATGLMHVHRMMEGFDTDEMAAIFRDLSFISLSEKLALVRAAVYELMVTNADLFVSAEYQQPVARPVAPVTEAPKKFSPPQFRLNVNRSETFTGERPADTNVAKPVVTSTHTPKVAEMKDRGAKEARAAEIERMAAVEEVRKTVEPIQIPDVPADASIPQE